MNGLTIQVIINLAAQGTISAKRSLEWFETLDARERTQTLTELVQCSWQAHVTGKDGGNAVTISGIRPTFTPCALLIKAAREDPDGEIVIGKSMNTIISLPPAESIKSFKVLVALLSVGEKKRRDRTGVSPEKYWWHQDLTNYDVLKEILKEKISEFPFWVLTNDN